MRQRPLERRPRPGQVPQVLQHIPRLLTRMATLGWSGPKARSSIASARSYAARAPA